MAVKNVWHDEELFCVELAGSKWKVTYSFPIKELAGGASLARMMNLRVRETHKSFGSMVPKDELREVAREGLAALRDVVEPYFEARGIGE